MKLPSSDSIPTKPGPNAPPVPEERYFAELSQSRMGYGADADLAEFLVDELRQRGLARPSEDGVSIPLHPVVRTAILVILGQLAREAGDRRGMAVHPATDWPEAATDLLDALSREPMPSCEGVVKLDLEPVTLDLSTIPLEEVLKAPGGPQGSAQGLHAQLKGFSGRTWTDQRPCGAGGRAAGEEAGDRRPGPR